jgi:hypothetical protein
MAMTDGTYRVGRSSDDDLLVIYRRKRVGGSRVTYYVYDDLLGPMQITGEKAKGLVHIGKARWQGEVAAVEQ